MRARSIGIVRWLVLLLTVTFAGGGVHRIYEVHAAQDEGDARARLEVDISDRKLRVRIGDEVTASYTVAVGTSKHPTPVGQFSIRRIVWNPSWVPPDSEWARDEKPTPPGHPDNPMGRVKIYFKAPTYYIHGTDAVGTLGTAASHGCLRMRNADVIELAKLVMEHGGERRSPGWFQRILNAITDTEEVRLSSPVAVTIRK